MADIDLDFKTTFDPKTIFPELVTASMIKDGKLVKHPCGHYIQNIATDPYTGLAAIPYDQAEQFGFFKIDFLHLQLLDKFNSKDEMRSMLAAEPWWELLLNEDHVAKLFQLSKHAELLAQIRPRSIQELADCVAMIRPNKRQYINAYAADKEKTRPLLYRSSGDDKSSFRRSHAIAYAATIVLQLHLIELGRL
jgi:hypothetical protein